MSAAPEVTTAPAEGLFAYKGFDADFRCRGMQYAVGETFSIDGDVIACERGLHACEYPLHVFTNYPPAHSRYAFVRAHGAISRPFTVRTDFAAATLAIEDEIDALALVQCATIQLLERGDPAAWQRVLGHHQAVSATGVGSLADIVGDRSVASATSTRSLAKADGYRSAACATASQAVACAEGYEVTASVTGLWSAARAVGDRSIASAAGDWSIASAAGDGSIASTAGYGSAADAQGYGSAVISTAELSRASTYGPRSTASVTGERSVASVINIESSASATGEMGAAEAMGWDSVALAAGIRGRVRAALGSAIVVCHRDAKGRLINIRAGIVGRDGLRPGVWYSLDADGQFVEAEVTS
jgi:hypothetical protein